MSKGFLHRVGEFREEAESQFRKLAGTTATIAFDAFAVTYWMAWLAVGVARRWQSDGFHVLSLAAILEFPMRGLYTVAIAAAWTLVLVGWLRYIRWWPRWWALPYTLVLLCPMAWFLSQRVRYGIDALILVLLQLPIIVGAICRSRARPSPG